MNNRRSLIDGKPIGLRSLLHEIEKFFCTPLLPAHRRPLKKIARRAILRLPFPLSAKSIAANLERSRRSKAHSYAKHRRHRPPPPDGISARVIFAHDPELSGKFQNLISEVEVITAESAAGNSGGREGMIAAVCLARHILSRLPSNKLAPIVGILGHLETALLDLHNGNIHPALKVDRPAGRPIDRLRREFKRRCVMAYLLGQEIDEPITYKTVYGIALPTAVSIGFKSPESGSRKGAPDGQLFTETTIANWVKDYRAIVRSEEQEALSEERMPWSNPHDLPELHDQELLEVTRRFGDPNVSYRAFTRGLSAGALLISIDDILGRS